MLLIRQPRHIQILQVKLKEPAIPFNRQPHKSFCSHRAPTNYVIRWKNNCGQLLSARLISSMDDSSIFCEDKWASYLISYYYCTHLQLHGRKINRKLGMSSFTHRHIATTFCEDNNPGPLIQRVCLQIHWYCKLSSVYSGYCGGGSFWGKHT